MITDCNAFEHILYCFEMYVRTFPPMGNQFIINMMTDSHQIHLRDMAYFFEEKEKKNVHGSIYISDFSSHSKNSKELAKAFEYTNNSTAHMSAERLKSDYKKRTIERRFKLGISGTS